MPKVTRRLLSRPPIERIMRIHSMLQAGERVNCAVVSRELEIAGRTANRDIEFMRDRLALPIEWDSRRNRYYYSRHVERLPLIPMTEAETFALLVAHKAIAQYHGTPFEKPLETAFRRLTGQLDRTVRFSMGNVAQVLSFRPFAPDDSDLKVFEALTRAVRERRVLRFLYRNRGSASFQRRDVHPYHLACIDNHWYLLAFDIKRSGMRTFSLTRMKQAELRRSRFVPNPAFDVDKFLGDSFGVFKGEPDGDYEVVVDFDAWAADEIRGRRWHKTQEITELPGGMLRLRMRLNNIEEVERWLLGFGGHATVIRPRILTQHFRETGRAFTTRYDSADGETRPSQP